jgi:RHS repeat-associated protein
MASTTTGTLNLDNFQLSQSTPIPTPIGPQAYHYVYDGDGALVLRIAGEVRIYSPGKHYDLEVSGSVTTVKKYYSLNGQTVAVRTIQGETDTLNWILNDHLGSANVTAAADGSKLAELRYSAFGEIRFSSGITPTEYQYTGQLNAEAGLIYYNARFYDPSTSHFVQSDSYIPYPDDSKSYDRYSYTRYNPIRYIDPSGHCDFEDGPGSCGRKSSTTIKSSSTSTNTITSKGDRDEKVLEPKVPPTVTISTQTSTSLPNNTDVLTTNHTESSTPISNFIKYVIPGTTTQWANSSTALDVMAEFTFIYAAGVVTYGGIAGAGIASPFIASGVPEVPVTTGLAGIAIAELYVQPVLKVGNVFASISTVGTIISETKADKTIIEKGEFSSATINSISLTAIGWNTSEAYISLAVQTTSVLNDFNITSLPFPKSKEK